MLQTEFGTKRSPQPHGIAKLALASGRRRKDSMKMPARTDGNLYTIGPPQLALELRMPRLAAKSIQPRSPTNSLFNACGHILTLLANNWQKMDNIKN